MSLISEFGPKEIVALATAVAFALADGKNTDEISALAGFWQQVGQTLSTISSQKELLDSMEEKAEKIKELKKELRKLEKDL